MRPIKYKFTYKWDFFPDIDFRFMHYDEKSFPYLFNRLEIFSGLETSDLLTRSESIFNED